MQEKRILKTIYRLQNGSHFVPGSMLYSFIRLRWSHTDKYHLAVIVLIQFIWTATVMYLILNWAAISKGNQLSGYIKDSIHLKNNLSKIFTCFINDVTSTRYYLHYVTTMRVFRESNGRYTDRQTGRQVPSSLPLSKSVVVLTPFAMIFSDYFINQRVFQH